MVVKGLPNLLACVLVLNLGCKSTDKVSMERRPNKLAFSTPVHELEDTSDHWVTFDGPAFSKSKTIELGDGEAVEEMLSDFAQMRVAKEDSDPYRPTTPPSTLNGISKITVGWIDIERRDVSETFTFDHINPAVYAEDLYPILEKLSRKHDLGFKRP